MPKPIAKLGAQILEEAGSWFIDFSEQEVGPAGREEFNAWLRRSPEHVRAFLQVSAFWEDAAVLGGRLKPDVDELIRRAQAEHNVHPLELAVRERPVDVVSMAEERAAAETEQSLRQRQGVKRRWYAAAAAMLISLGSAAGWYTLYRGAVYATEVAEQRSITLEDGSSVELNSRSRIRVRYTAERRSVDLLEGQALFTVAKNPARPFIVISGGTSVRAVGTRFDVYRKRGGTVVTVVEGRVAVAARARVSNAPLAVPPRGDERPMRGSRVAVSVPDASTGREGVRGAGPEEILLVAGEQLVITPAAVELPKPANVTAATAWTDKRLVFESTPLREVVEEFNRYNRQQLVILDPDLYDFHVSGVFPSTDSSRMVEFLRQRFGITMNRSRGEIEISRREAAPDGASLQPRMRGESGPQHREENPR